MNIHFWGVRGSIPSPLTPGQIKAKISTVLQRATPEDVVNDESRERFLASLPRWVYGTVGGNTACVELVADKGTKLIFDAGSGIRVMGILSAPPEDFHYHMLFSHFHWDHIQGLPFFGQAYNPRAVFDVYSPYPDMEKYLVDQMTSPYFPVPFSGLSKNFVFHVIKTEEPFEIDGLKVACTEMFHPGKSFSYRVEETCADGTKKAFVYATDVELGEKDFVKTPEAARVFENADVLVLDSQYTVEELHRKPNWGHSAFCYAIDFAAVWNIKHLYLFHHEPTYDDRKIDSIYESAKWYANYSTNNTVSVHVAVEGQSVII